MSWKNYSIVISAALLASRIAMASGYAANSSITGANSLAIDSTTGNWVYIHLTPGPTTPAACNTGGFWSFTLDLSTPTGVNLYALLLSAQAQGKTIAVYGTGACSQDPTV